MDWVSPVSSGSQADKNVKSGVLAFQTQTHTPGLFALSPEMTQGSKRMTETDTKTENIHTCYNLIYHM